MLVLIRDFILYMSQSKHMPTGCPEKTRSRHTNSQKDFGRCSKFRSNIDGKTGQVPIPQQVLRFRSPRLGNSAPGSEIIFSLLAG